MTVKRDLFNTAAQARRLDAADPLRKFRGCFAMPVGTIYLLGNSLGLMPKSAGKAVQRILREWQHLAIDGWLAGKPPWFNMAEELGARAAPLVGAAVDEVIATASTTVNIHALLSTFFRPQGRRRKIVALADDFPSDIYALRGQLKLRGLDPEKDLILIPSGQERLLDESVLAKYLCADIALALFSSVLYRSGQLLDLPFLTRQAHERGVTIGFDLCHSAGVVPHRLSQWGVDFAMWCGYKYLNGGPGSMAFLYVNRRHFGCEPLLAGWFGCDKTKQFSLSPDFPYAHSAGGWQISSPAILSAVTLENSLEILRQAKIELLREKSLRLTGYLMELIDSEFAHSPLELRIVNPRPAERRGGQVSLSLAAQAWEVCQALRQRRVMVDFRPPDILRLAPAPLYNTFFDVWQAVRHLREILHSGEYRRFSSRRSAIT